MASSAVCPRTLHTGVDGSKDQSYFLALVPPTAFERAIFPLGHLHKTQVSDSLPLCGSVNWGCALYVRVFVCLCVMVVV